MNVLFNILFETGEWLAELQAATACSLHWWIFADRASW